jgi:hypothetical protein
MSSGCLGPLSGRIHIRILCMDQNTPDASHSHQSLTCGPHVSASPLTSSHPEGRRPTRWEGQADTARGGREPDLPHGSFIQASPRRQQAWPAAARKDHDSMLFDLPSSTPSTSVLRLVPRPRAFDVTCKWTPKPCLEACRSPGQAVACSKLRDNKMSSPPSLLTFTPRPNSSQLRHPFPIPRTYGCARLLASPWT